MGSVWYWVAFAVNVVLFGACFYMILKRREYTCISMRSPLLLLTNNVASFLTISCVLLAVNVENSSKIFGWLYYMFQSLMVISLCLRSQRIISCCEVKRDERYDIQQFYQKRYKFQENYYVKILLITFAIIVVILIILNFAFKLQDLPFAYPYMRIKDKDIVEAEEKILYFYLVFNFLQEFALIAYAYNLAVKSIKQRIVFEIIASIITWFIYINITTILIMIDEKRIDINIVISIVVHYALLIFNGFVPIYLSYSYRTSISYHFSPKLMNNLYLFLTDENCYKVFAAYLSRQRGDNPYYLRMYTHIMKYKLGYMMKENDESLLEQAKVIHSTYFNKSNSKISMELLAKVSRNCQSLENNTYKLDIFDDALAFAYKQLNLKFSDFRKTQDFSELSETLSLQSYVQCKMCNTGLINRF